MILAEPVGGGDPRQTTETSSDPHGQKFPKVVSAGIARERRPTEGVRTSRDFAAARQ